MSPGTTFVVLLAVTLVLLPCVVLTGLAARRRWHLSLVAATLVSLALTIVAAERLGASYDLASAGLIKPVHLAFAKLASLSYVLPLATGIRTIRNPAGRGLHRRCAILTLVLTVISAVTGAWMLLAAEPLG